MGGLGEDLRSVISVVGGGPSHQPVPGCVSGEGGVLRQGQPERKRLLQVSEFPTPVIKFEPDFNGFPGCFFLSGLRISNTILIPTRAESLTTSPMACPAPRWRSTA